MFKIDYWYKNGREARKEVAFVSVTFYPNEGLYRGNLFNSNKKAVGDFTSDDSVEIEEHVPGIFGE